MTHTAAGSHTVEQGQKDGFTVYHLKDSTRNIEVSIVPAVGNLAYRMAVKGENIFWMPSENLREVKERQMLGGNPFLAPWANRLEEDGFWASGVHYQLNPELKNFRRDANGKPIHGLVAFTDRWEVVETGASADAAWIRCRLPFSRYPDWMAQFPFSHTLEMTYKLSFGRLEVRTRIENHASVAMPVAIGYHPYFRVGDAPRDDWKVRVAATRHMTLSQQLLPTGESTPYDASAIRSLRGGQLDDVFSGLVRDPLGNAVFHVTGARQKVSVIYGPRYHVAVVYAPKGRDFICFEPMAAVTNALALAHRGAYADLESVSPGGVWEESFWIEPDGF